MRVYWIARYVIHNIYDLQRNLDLVHATFALRSRCIRVAFALIAFVRVIRVYRSRAQKSRWGSHANAIIAFFVKKSQVLFYHLISGGIFTEEL